MAGGRNRIKSLQHIIVERLLGLCLVASLGIGDCLAWAAPSVQLVQRELEKISTEMALEQQQLAVLQDQILQMAASQQNSKEQLEHLKKIKAEAEAELAKIGKTLEQQLAAFNPIEDAIAAVKNKAIQRIRASYMFNSRGGVEALLNSGPESLGLVRTSHYLGILRDSDQKLVSGYTHKLGLRDQKQSEIDTIKRRQEKLQLELEDQQRQIDDQASWELDLSSQLKKEQAQSKHNLQALISKQAKLLAFLKRSVSSNRASQLGSNQPKPAAASAKIAPEIVSGKGLVPVSKLPWPVEGHILRHYGKYKSQELGETLFSKGLEISTNGQVPVGAIAEGQVIFTGQMPGYGLVVILDHGKRFYSVYGMLSSVFSTLGDRVKVRQKLGVTGAAAGGDSNLYFEIRENGAARDPMLFLAP